MNTFTQILYQIVFSTKDREKTLLEENLERLFKYITGILKNNDCHLYRIGGVSDHLHIVTHIHPSISLASLVKDIKVSSNIFIKNTNIFPDFSCWQVGYGAFTYSIKSKNRLIEYVKNQKQHHAVKTYKTELIELLNEHGIPWDEKYLL